MKSSEYIPLNSWLQNADMLYVDGRMLWLNWGIGSSLILLWLSLEQIMKTLIFQRRIENNEFTSDKSEEVFDKFNEWGMKISHSLTDNIAIFDKYYSGVLKKEDKEV